VISYKELAARLEQVDAELAIHANPVDLAPLFDDLAAFHANDADLGHANDFPVGGQALVRAEVSAPRDEARDHPLTIDH